MAKEVNVLYGTMFTVLRRDLKISPFKHMRKQLLSAKTVEKCLARARILLTHLEAGMLPNLIFSNKKKFDVQHYVSSQNDHVWLHDGEIGPQRVTWAQGVASVMVWAAITESGRSPLVFVEQGVKLNQENYRSDILVGSCPGQKNISKNVL